MQKPGRPNYGPEDYRAYVLPHGQVADISLPPDWNEYVGDNVSKFVTNEQGDTVADGPFGPLTITSVPPRAASGQDDPDGHTEFFFLSEDTRKKVFNYAGFPQPLGNPEVPNYVVRQAPGMGLGVYATRDLRIGDLIWAERPLIVAPAAMVPPEGASIGEHHTEAQGNAMRHYLAERTVEEIVRRMSPERKALFMALANSHTEDGSGPCSGIIRSNQLEIRMAEGKPGHHSGDSFWRYCAVGDVLSRTNHSCIPNIHYSFDFASFSLRIYAFANIEKGEQFVWSYVGQEPNTDVRQSELSPYGFRCKCRLCLASENQRAMWKILRDQSTVLISETRTKLQKEDAVKAFSLRSRTEKRSARREYMKTAQRLEEFKIAHEDMGELNVVDLVDILHQLYIRIGDDAKQGEYADHIRGWKICDNIMHEPYI